MMRSNWQKRPPGSDPNLNHDSVSDFALANIFRSLNSSYSGTPSALVYPFNPDPSGVYGRGSSLLVFTKAYDLLRPLPWKRIGRLSIQLLLLVLFAISVLTWAPVVAICHYTH
jgi:hypothetical protein